jgi:hypothetical protein
MTGEHVVKQGYYRNQWSQVMENESMEEKIRARAYELWEKDGSPAGQADKYWEQARASLEGDLLAAATSPSAAAGSSASAGAPDEGKAANKGTPSSKDK